MTESPTGHAQRQALRLRDGLVVVLALTTGALDAVTFIRLGKVFSSVITGNLALLGVAAGQRHGELALSGGLALAGYGAGVLVGGAATGPAQKQQPLWPWRVTATLAGELLVLAGFSGGWLAVGGQPGGAVRVTLLLIAAVAMGMQSATVRRLGPMSTTYLTSTLIGILESLSFRRSPADWQRSMGVLIAFVAGAALGAAAATQEPSLVPVAVLVPLAAVVAGAATAASLRRPRESGLAVRESGPRPGGQRPGLEHGGRQRGAGAGRGAGRLGDAR